MTPKELRALVPAAQTSVYLNAAASSPLPIPVADRVRAHLGEIVERGDVGFPRWLAERERIRARVARFLSVDPREIALLSSTSLAFSLFARMLRARGVTQVVTLEGEFPSTTVPLLHAGLELRAVRARGGAYAPEDIERACTPSTGAIALSIVQYASGFRVDLDAVKRVARGRKLALALNGSQALGHVPFDLADADFFAAACHKWLMAGYGHAIFFARREWLAELPMAGWLSVEGEDLWKTLGPSREEEGALVAKGVRVRAEASALEVGGGVWSLYPALDEAFALHEALGPVIEHDLALQRALRAGLRARGFAPNAPDDPAVSSGITVVPVIDPEGAVRALAGRGVITTARGGGLRISTHVYNDESDLERFFHALDGAGIRPC